MRRGALMPQVSATDPPGRPRVDVRGWRGSAWPIFEPIFAVPSMNLDREGRQTPSVSPGKSFSFHARTLSSESADSRHRGYTRASEGSPAIRLAPVGLAAGQPGSL